MKRTIYILVAFTFTLPTKADSIIDGISIAGDSIYGYTSYVQILGLIISVIVGLIGAFSIFYAIQKDDPNVKKKLIIWGASTVGCLTMTLSIPNFFGYQESGLTSEVGSHFGDGTHAGGDTYGTIITRIPPLSDPSWYPNGIYYEYHTVSGIPEEALHNYMYAIYDKIVEEGGLNGSYGRILDYLESEYQNGTIEEDIYTDLMSFSGSLPHY